MACGMQSSLVILDIAIFIGWHIWSLPRDL